MNQAKYRLDILKMVCLLENCKIIKMEKSHREFGSVVWVNEIQALIHFKKVSILEVFKLI